MAPGSWNNKNYGGLHTGTGKYQKGGVYSTNGLRHKKIPNNKFTDGTEVRYMGKHKDHVNVRGKVVSKKDDTHKSGRSIIKVETNENKYTYFHKNNLELV